jgi:serine/threonine protein kinase
MAKNTPDISSTPPMSESDRLSDLVSEWERERQAGREPDVEELCDGSPELASEFRTRVAALKSFYREFETDVPSTVGPQVGGSSGETKPDPPALLKRYELCEEVGRGGMGVVYRGRHSLLNKTVAIKVCLAETLTDRFQREGQILASVSSPFIVAVHDFEFIGSGRAVLVMDWVEGGNLEQVIRAAAGPIPEHRALRWMSQVCQGMQQAADCGIVHRDLKPSNILIDGNDQARVADFGLARKQESWQLTHCGGPMGTPHYMAPEQAEDPRNVDTRADIYSFGATFYHVMTGSPPFQGETPFAVLFKHKVEPLVSPIACNERLSKRTSDVLERCLAKSPVDRFSSFSDVLTVLSDKADEDPWLSDDDPQLSGLFSAYAAKRESYLQRGDSRELDVFTFPAGRTLRIVRGDIVKQQVDAIVSSSDDYLSMNAGVAHAIGVAGGPFLLEYAERLAPVRPGRAVVTSAGCGNLLCRFVIHAVTVGIHENAWVFPSRDLIAELVASSFYQADCHKVFSIAFPLLGTGAQGFPIDTCLDTMFRCIARALLRGLTLVEDVRIVIYNKPPEKQAEIFVKMVFDPVDLDHNHK